MTRHEAAEHAATYAAAYQEARKELERVLRDVEPLLRPTVKQAAEELLRAGQLALLARFAADAKVDAEDAAEALERVVETGVVPEVGT